jgi:ATP-dependent Clp protease adaptor protein ClpS
VKCAVLEAEIETPKRKTAVLEPEVETRDKTRLSPQWKVILLDDDVTTIDFVVDLIVSVFRKPRDEAIKLTNEVHVSGSAIITITSLERAELYVDQVKSLARPRGFPLTATLEPA